MNKPLTTIILLYFSDATNAESYSCAFLGYGSHKPQSAIYQRWGEKFVSGTSFVQEWDVDENEFILLLTRKGVESDNAFSGAGAFVFVRIIDKINFTYFHSAEKNEANEIEIRTGNYVLSPDD